MKRWNFGGSRHPRQLGQHRSPRLDRPAPGSRQGVQGQEDGRPHGRRAGHHPEPQGRADRSDRGLIMVEGRGPGRQGRLDLLRDAVKKPLPDGRPDAGSVPQGSQAADKPARRPAEAPAPRQARRDPEKGTSDGVRKVTTLDGKAAGTVELPDEIFGLEPRADILQRMVRWQLAKRRAGTHKTNARRDHAAPRPRRCTSRRAPVAPATAPRRRRSSAAAARRSGRWCAATPRPAEEGAGAGAEARPVGQGKPTTS
jgi:hypothetical protein